MPVKKVRIVKIGFEKYLIGKIRKGISVSLFKKAAQIMGVVR